MISNSWLPSLSLRGAIATKQSRSAGACLPLEEGNERPTCGIATQEPVLSTMRFFATLRMTTSEGTRNDICEAIFGGKRQINE